MKKDKGALVLFHAQLGPFLRDEVADAAELADEHYKDRFGEHTSTWPGDSRR